MKGSVALRMRCNIGARMKLSVCVCGAGGGCRKENNKQADGGQAKGNTTLRDGVPSSRPRP